MAAPAAIALGLLEHLVSHSDQRGFLAGVAVLLGEGVGYLMLYAAGLALFAPAAWRELSAWCGRCAMPGEPCAQPGGAEVHFSWDDKRRCHGTIFIERIRSDVSSWCRYSVNSIGVVGGIRPYSASAGFIDTGVY